MLTEWIILADYVEFTSGKLYMMGGGWDQVTINHPARLHSFGIATAFRVEWDEVTVPHDVTVSVLEHESDVQLLELQAVLDLGASPGFVQGSSQLAQLALNASVEFRTQGTHYLKTTIDGREDRRFPFLIRFGNDLLEGSTD